MSNRITHNWSQDLQLCEFLHTSRFSLLTLSKINALMNLQHKQKSMLSCHSHFFEIRELWNRFVQLCPATVHVLLCSEFSIWLKQLSVESRGNFHCCTTFTGTLTVNMVESVHFHRRVQKRCYTHHQLLSVTSVLTVKLPSIKITKTKYLFKTQNMKSHSDIKISISIIFVVWMMCVRMKM